MINVAILGFGTVGSGVYEVFKINKEIINKQIDDKINVKYILDLKEFKGTEIEEKVTSDYNDILNDDDVRVVIEVLGGIEPAYTFVKKALAKGKSVVTSNKELVAKHGPELIEISRHTNCNFLFEASVGGGIPIIRPLYKSLVANEISEIKGILNGTTNYILTKMEKEGYAFDEVLKKAQELGYAEKNPEADVEGYDTCRKIAILTSLVYGKFVNYEDIYTEGITKVTKEDILYAKEAGYTIKLIATSKKVDDKVFAYVAPTFIGSEHPLANVHDVFNAVFLHGNAVDDLMFYGRGAGKMPTASAVCADVVSAIKHFNTHIKVNLSEEKMPIESFEHAAFAYFIRLDKVLTNEEKAELKSILGDVKYFNVDLDEVGLITGEISEKDIESYVSRIEKAGFTVLSRIRVED